MASPLVYDATTSAGVGEAVLAVTAERGLPSVEWRAQAVMLNDILTGLAIMIFGAMSLLRRDAWFGQWANVLRVFGFSSRLSSSGLRARGSTSTP